MGTYRAILSISRVSELSSVLRSSSNPSWVSATLVGASPAFQLSISSRSLSWRPKDNRKVSKGW